MQVLLVMTHPVRRILFDSLQLLGTEPVVAADLRSLEKTFAGQPPPAAVLTQVALSDGNWRDLLDRVRQLWGDIPVAVCSSLGGDERRFLDQDIRKFGAVALIPLPCSLAQLNSFVELAMARCKSSP